MILYYLEYVCNIYNIGFVITIERLPCRLWGAKKMIHSEKVLRQFGW